MHFQRLFAWLTALSVCVVPAVAQAQEHYPSKPVTIIVPLPAGGLPDVVTRALASGLQSRLGQAVVVENKPGANTRIAAQACAAANADGHTLCVLSAPTVSINPWLYEKLNYDPDKSFAPISNLVAADVLLAVHPSVGARSWRELAERARAQPGKLAYASFGVGSDVHLTMEWLRKQADADLLHVPFLGFPQIIQGVGSGDVQVVLVSLGNPGVVDYVKSARLLPIALHGAKRSPLVPDVPTFAEAGLPKVDVFSWFGLFAPKGTPVGVLQRLNAEVNAVMSSAEFQQRTLPLAVTPMNGSAAEFSAFLAKDRESWGRMVRAASVKLSD